MKQIANRQNIDTLYILGAGASYGLTCLKNGSNFSKSVTPLDKDFLKSLETAKPNIGWRKTSTEKVLGDWFDRVGTTQHGLEEAIIKRVSQYEFLSNLHPTRIKGKCSNEDYLNHLSHLITAYLAKCKPNATNGAKKLTNHIFPSTTRIGDHTNRVITFNYDTLIEKPLLERGISRKKVYFDRLVGDKKDGVRRSSMERFPHPLVLKLHGSVNWRCKREHFDDLIKGTIDPNEKIVIWQDDDSDPQPNDDLSPLIIPPIPNKPITQAALFKFLWTLAYEYMHQAMKIVIIGYSCPATDTLARTMFSQFKSSTLSEVIVVDPDAIALKDYREMFEPVTASRAKWGYYSSIAEYIDVEIS